MPHYVREVLLEGTEPVGAIRKGLDSGGDLGSRQGSHRGSWPKFRRYLTAVRPIPRLLDWDVRKYVQL